jgi:short-subunit dehydrogenase
MSDVVVITGASGGIGRATARRFAEDGAKIALLARGGAGGGGGARADRRLDQRRDSDDLRGVPRHRAGRVPACNRRHLPRLVWGTRSALKRMSERNRGSIVRVCSAMSYRGIPLQAPYCGAKAACKNFTESVLTEIRHHG